jgi:hypothetical protein
MNYSQHTGCPRYAGCTGCQQCTDYSRCVFDTRGFFKCKTNQSPRSKFVNVGTSQPIHTPPLNGISHYNRYGGNAIEGFTSNKKLYRTVVKPGDDVSDAATQCAKICNDCLKCRAKHHQTRQLYCPSCDNCEVCEDIMTSMYTNMKSYP